MLYICVYIYIYIYIYYILLESFSDGLFVLSSKIICKIFLSGSKNSLLRNMVSYKSDSNTVAALSGNCSTVFRKTALTQAIFS